MLKDFTIANLLDLNETIAKDLFEGKTYPWEFPVKKEINCDIT